MSNMYGHFKSLAIKALILLFLLALAGGLLHFLIQETGKVSIQWYGFNFDINAKAFATLLLFAGIFLFYSGKVWSWLSFLPKRLQYWRNERNNNQALELLGEGFEALASDDNKSANQKAHKALKLISNEKQKHVARLLVVQASKDKNTQEQTQLILDSKPNSTLGLQSMITCHFQSLDWAEANNIAERAYKSHPKTIWATKALFEARQHLHRYPQALELINKLRRIGAYDAEELDVIEASILTHQGEVIAPQDSKAALEKYQTALKTAKNFAPALFLEISTLEKLGKNNKAQQLLADFWRATQDKEVFEHWLSLTDKINSNKLVKKTHELIKGKDKTLAGRIALATVYLHKQEWVDAKKTLMLAHEETPSVEVYQLLAELDEQTHGTSSANNGTIKWLHKALTIQEQSKDKNANHKDNHRTDYQNWKKVYLHGEQTQLSVAHG